MRQFRLHDSVHACCVGGHVILLDLEQDRYFGFDASAIAEVSAWIEDLPATVSGSNAEPISRGSTDSTGPTDPTVPAATHPLLGELVQRGLAVSQAANAPSFERTGSALSAPSSSLVEGYEQIDAAPRAADVFRFVTASLIAKALIQFRPLHRIVQRVRARAAHRRQHANARGALVKFDAIEARRVVALYSRLRLFLFADRDACLFDSLALSELLAKYGLHPNWVFGVRTEPFMAHCWLQHGDLVINDSTQRVREFTPILVV